VENSGSWLNGAALLLGLYMFFDVAYYLRGFLTLGMCAIRSRFINSRVNSLQGLKTLLMTPSITKGICWFTDLDLMFHMNNARYLRECDFARFKFLTNCGISFALRRSGFTMVLGGSTIRYRRSIGLFEHFYIATKVVGWDERNLYISHEFHLSSNDFIAAVAIAKQSLVQGDTQSLFKAVLRSTGQDPTSNTIASPPFPDELTKWLESNECSSRRLNPSKNGKTQNLAEAELTRADVQKNGNDY